MSAASRILKKQFRELQSDPASGFSAGLVNDDIFKWRVTLIGPPNTPYEGGVFPAVLDFPDDYPNIPPKMKFICPMYHPNIRETGEVCISILHPPGEDIYEYEDRSERWLPIHTVESILLSVISMLSDPNCESPENVDAAKTFKNDQREYMRKVRKTVEQSYDYC
ncbi:Ubiquitin-conjugating enzyme E2 15 [Tritrichomonas foetus]|uniref:Ubiquitin-conjugating enzyme E2 15 n=1 Tax=Tritrichomonas foetus TaxID=1144522 RepID=A0A1J4KS92_9EUKA|nr:Ubiquitin-conjugating enzyme E2 15 [Tritrichomonas foetus]|eukprot:OHT14151.1 Ubiquitin-conjugating enzyme E2 15 [Tritrichomonas foetus]